MSSFGIYSEDLGGAAGGFYQRINWWIEIIKSLSDDLYSLLFGFGYGDVLVNFGIKNNIQIREPHNSYISIFARGGLISFTFFVWAHFLLIKIWYKLFRHYKKTSDRIKNNQLSFFMIYFISIWTLAFAQDAFEKPFYIIPYYFFWGIVLRMYFMSNIKKKI